MNLKTSLLSFVFVVLCFSSQAQTTSQVYWNYIDTYRNMAQDQMQRHRIPASITLAQGLLESAAGRSELAVRANNHFGIKVGTGWNGPYVVMSDDTPNDRFRKYGSVSESYEDHSLFLQKPRYQSLFKLSMTDYKGWAKGLKECGYATNPAYAQQLITIIENYGLHQYDNLKHKKEKREKAASQQPPTVQELAAEAFFAQHPIYSCNHSYYVIARQGDNLATLARMMNVSERNLQKYNELPDGYVLNAGDVIYLQKKRRYADKSLKGVPHLVQAGESMHDIAQHYGMQLKYLYRLNGLSEDYVPQVGHLLRLY